MKKLFITTFVLLTALMAQAQTKIWYKGIFHPRHQENGLALGQLVFYS